MKEFKCNPPSLSESHRLIANKTRVYRNTPPEQRNDESRHFFSLNRDSESGSTELSWSTTFSALTLMLAEAGKESFIVHLAIKKAASMLPDKLMETQPM